MCNETQNMRNILVFALGVTVAAPAPPRQEATLPGVAKTDRIGAPELFAYRGIVVGWYCAKSTTQGTVPCMKKRMLDNLRKTRLGDVEMATDDAMERMTRTVRSRDVAVREYTEMFRMFCKDSVHTLREEICANSILRKAYGV